MKRLCLAALLACLFLTACGAPGGETAEAAVPTESTALTETAVSTEAASALTEAAAEEEPAAEEEAPDPYREAFEAAGFRAVVTSDLHYTENRQTDSSIVPGMAFAQEITDAMVAQVIDEHPDVFIMTGDNTNSGSTADAEGLAAKLLPLKEAGIQIVLTTGNHDFNRMDEAEYERIYFPLLTPVDRDSASLSYTAVSGDVVMLAMDDNAVDPGGHGEFFPETMEWLKEMLARYEGRPILFLSHHSAAYGRHAENSRSYRIQNDDLAPLLRQHGVQLALTGHLHMQYITEDAGLYEIISAMPFSSGNRIGYLSFDGTAYDYAVRPIDLAQYGSPSMVRRLARRTGEAAEKQSASFREILKAEGLRGNRLERGLALLEKFFASYAEGTIAARREEFLSDPEWDRLVEALWERNYGPWMKSTVEETRLDASRLHLEYEAKSKN